MLSPEDKRYSSRLAGPSTAHRFSSHFAESQSLLFENGQCVCIVGVIAVDVVAEGNRSMSTPLQVDGNEVVLRAARLREHHRQPDHLAHGLQRTAAALVVGGEDGLRVDRVNKSSPWLLYSPSASPDCD